MSSDKFKKLLADLEFVVGGEPSEWYPARENLIKYVEDLEEALHNVVKCNDEAMPDPVNEQWLGSPCREQCMKALGDKE